jgi:hypothetical protein
MMIVLLFSHDGVGRKKLIDGEGGKERRRVIRAVF